MTHPNISAKIPKKTIFYSVLLSIFFSSGVGFLCYTEALPLYYIDNFLYDSYLRHQSSGVISDKVVVIDVDERSINSIGQWPWPRYRIAELIEKLGEMQPSAIGIDIVFPEPDRTSPATLKRSFENDFNLNVSFTGIPDHLIDNDMLLGHALSKTQSIGATYFYFDAQESYESCLEPPLLIEDKLDLLDLYQATKALCSTYVINNQTEHNGFINSMLDKDGLMRQTLMAVEYNGQYHPNLSLAALMHSLKIDYAEIVKGKYGPVLKVGPYDVPITKDGFAFLHFHAPAFQPNTLSAIDIIEETIAAEDVQGKIVFIGTSAIGLGDIVATPVDKIFPGVQTYSLMVDNILQSANLYKPDWTNIAIFLSCMITGLLMVLLFARSRGPVTLFLGTVAISLILLLSALFFVTVEKVFLSPGSPMLVAVGLFTLFSTIRFAVEKKAAYMWYQQVSNVQQVTIESMATVAETRDPETGAHIRRTQHYVKAIAEHLLKKGLFKAIVTLEYIEMLFLSAPLHDIGKVGVPDYILLKPGKLTADEYEEMKKHTEYGRKTLHSSMKKIEGDNFLEIAGEIAYTHHEKWDGTGYPQGLIGANIPLSGRLMAVADVYDALTSKRCYKNPFSHEEAKRIMIEGQNTYFDPTVLGAFLEIEDSIIDIGARLKDE